MQPAFFLGGILPPPAAFALMLSRKNRSCTWFTTNTHESFFMEFVIRDIVLPDIIPYLL